jgi:hypothetical protein
MSDNIEWMDQPSDGRERFPKLLAQIKAEQLASTRHRGMWAKLAEYAVEGSARDAANRLAKKHDEFDFITRKEDEVTVVYVQLKAEVTA